MATLLKLKAVAEAKGCSRKSVLRACEYGKLNSEFDPVNGEYQVYDDEKLAQWQPGPSGEAPGQP